MNEEHSQRLGCDRTVWMDDMMEYHTEKMNNLDRINDGDTQHLTSEGVIPEIIQTDDSSCDHCGEISLDLRYNIDTKLYECPQCLQGSTETQNPNSYGQDPIDAKGSTETQNPNSCGQDPIDAKGSTETQSPIGHGQDPIDAVNDVRETQKPNSHGQDPINAVDDFGNDVPETQNPNSHGQNPVDSVDDAVNDVILIDDVIDAVADYECRFCENSFATIESLVEHTELIHRHEEQIKCPFYDDCGKVFRLNELQDMFEHVGINHPDIKIEKKEIASSTPVEKLPLEKSLDDKHGKVFLPNELLDIEKHVEKDHSNNIIENKHVEKDHSNDVIENEQIPKSTPTGKSSQGKSPSEAVKCHRCDKILSSRNYLYRHLRYHDNIRPYRCRFCGRKYVETGHLYSHIKRRHGNKEPLKCPLYPVCSKTFWLKERLTSHITNSHKGNIPNSRSAEGRTNNVTKNDKQMKAPILHKAKDKTLGPSIGSRKCDSCGKVLDITSNSYRCRHCWDKWAMSFSRPEKSPIKCPFYERCGVTGWSHEVVDRHVHHAHALYTYRQQVPYYANEEIICYYCLRFFNSKRTLRDHIIKCVVVNKLYSIRNATKQGIVDTETQEVVYVSDDDDESLSHTQNYDTTNNSSRTVTSQMTADRVLNNSKNQPVIICDVPFENGNIDFTISSESASEANVFVSDDDEISSHTSNHNPAGSRSVTGPMTTDQVLNNSENQPVIICYVPFENGNIDFTISSESASEANVFVSDDDEISSHTSNHNPAGSRSVTGPVTTDQVLSSENQPVMVRNMPFENGNSEFTISSESASEVNVISIVPLDSEHDLQVVEMDCDSLEGDSDHVIHNIVPINEDTNLCKDESSDWPVISEGAIKAEDSQLVPLAVLPEYN